MIINKKAFSIIEIMIWSLVFSIGILSAYSMVSTTLKLNNYNRDYIIASMLAKEQIEQIRYIRDVNYAKIQAYNKINPNTQDYESDDFFQTWSYYKIDNAYSSTSDFSVSVLKNDSYAWEETLDKLEQFRLCINDWLYSYNCDLYWSIETNFFKFIKVLPINYKDWEVTESIDNWFKVNSKVYWYDGKLRNFEINSIFTDFKIF